MSLLSCDDPFNGLAAACVRGTGGRGAEDRPLAPEARRQVRTHLRRRAARLTGWLAPVRTALAFGTAGYLFIDALVTTAALPSLLWLLIGYALVNVVAHALLRAADTRTAEAAPWIYAGMDVALIFSVHYASALPAPVPVTLVGLLALVLLTYTLYGHPRLSASLALTALLAASVSLYVLPAVPAGGSPVELFVLIEFLSIACLLTCLLALHLRRQSVAHYAELYRRTEAAAAGAVEQDRRQRLEEVDRLKRDFITVLSHELRNPITPLLTALEALQERTAPVDPHDEMLDVAAASADRLHRLIEDYTELAGLLVRSREDEPYWNLPMDALMEALTREAPPGRLRIEGLSNVTASGNPHLVRGALRAVLRRAEGRTPDGGATTVHSTCDDEHVTITVHDPASHLDADAIAALKDPYAPSHERLFPSGATGLELILAQHALHRTGGCLDIESDPDTGTAVHCRLPVSRPDQPWLDEKQLDSAVFG